MCELYVSVAVSPSLPELRVVKRVCCCQCRYDNKDEDEDVLIAAVADSSDDVAVMSCL